MSPLCWRWRGSGRRADRRRPSTSTQWFRAVDALHREREDEGGAQGLLAFAPVLREYDDVFRLAVAPQLLLGPLLGVAGALGRRRA